MELVGTSDRGIGVTGASNSGIDVKGTSNSLEVDKAAVQRVSNTIGVQGTANVIGVSGEAGSVGGGVGVYASRLAETCDVLTTVETVASFAA